MNSDNQEYTRQHHDNNYFQNISNSNSLDKKKLHSSSHPNFADFNFVESEIERAILNAHDRPMDTSETEEINVRGYTGVWLNKREVREWEEKSKRRRHSTIITVPRIEDYEINDDPMPEIIYKKTTQKCEYTQDITLRLLRPPTPPSPGDIFIRQEASVRPPPAPPLILRQYPPVQRPQTPLPLIIREKPPQAPPVIPTKLITISGKVLPPPPRKVIIERLPQLPAKPQAVLVERWLPYQRQKRRVIFKAASPQPEIVKPRNLVIEWQSPNVICRKEFKNLGVHRANPLEYQQLYRGQLLEESQLPQFVHEIQVPEDIRALVNSKEKGSNYNRRHGVLYDLEGDVDALKLIDLDREGLSEYKSFIESVQPTKPLTPAKINDEREDQEEEALIRSYFTHQTAEYYNAHKILQQQQSTSSAQADDSSHLDEKILNEQHLDELIYQIFRSIDTQNTGKIGFEEARHTLVQLNSRLIKKFEENELNAIMSCLCKEGTSEQTVNFGSFRKAFMLLSADYL